MALCSFVLGNGTLVWWLDIPWCRYGLKEKEKGKTRGNLRERGKNCVGHMISGSLGCLPSHLRVHARKLIISKTIDSSGRLETLSHYHPTLNFLQAYSSALDLDVMR